MNKKLLYIFAFIFACSSVAAQSTSQTITATGSGTFTVPCGVTSLSVEVWGGGGGGGGANTAGFFAGGGSGGGYVRRTITTSGGTVFNYNIGQGGQGGNLSSNGTNGQSSWFSSISTLLAVGGNGAENASIIFGAGATAPNTGNVGTASSYGNNGGWGYNLFLIYGTGAGGKGGGSAGGAGGSSISAFLSSLNSSNGNNGSQPGGGGSGAYSKNTGDNKFGGNGGNGQIIITYTLPRPTANAGTDFTKTCINFPSGKQIGFTPITGVTYSWSPATGLSNPNISNPIANPSSTTTYTVTATDGCGYTNMDSVVVTVSSTQAAPTIGTIVQPTCATAVGSVSLSGLPSGSWTLTPYLNGVAQTVITGSGVTTTVAGLVAGNYMFIISNGSCTSGFSAVANINAQPITPATPTIGTITQPTCTTATGSVVVNGLPSGSWTLTPSLGGVDQTAITGTGTSYIASNLVAGTYTFRISNGSCTSSVSANAIIAAQPITPSAPIIGVITQPTCATATGSVVLSGLPSTGTWTLTPSLGGVAQTAITGTGTSFTVTSILTGTYTFTVNNGSCTSSVSANVIIAAQPSTPTAPLISTIFGTSCTSNTGSIELTGLPSGAWTLTPYLNGVAQATISGTGTSTTVANLTLGSYTFIVANGTCTSVASAPAVVTDNSTTTWNGTTWSNLVPDASKVAIISGNYDMSTLTNIDACSVIINSPAKITVAANKFLTIQNDLTVNSGASLDVLDQGSLVMLNDSGVVTNNGTTTIRKVTTPYEKFDYTYWSAPTATTIGGALSAWRQDYSFEFRTANFADLNEDTFDDNRDDWVRVSQSTPMSAGKGYAIMAPTTGTFPTTREVVFSGKVNNGLITQNVFLSANNASNADDKNLLGNPYPSAISADMFLLANPSLQGTIYLWTHVKNISVSNPGPDVLNFKSDDYAMYNFSGGVGVGVAPEGGNSANASNAIPAGFIASGQGFFVGVDYNSTIVFNNSMRSKSFDNTNFYRAADETASLEKDRIWLNLQNKDGMFSQQLIGYFDNATLGFDRGYDGIVSKTSNYVSFYSFIDQDIYRIQGRPAFNENDTVPLGYSSAVADTFTITIDTKEGKLNNRSTNIYLEDKLLNGIHDLKQGPYSFTTAKGTFNDRFVLRYQSPTLGTNDLEALANEVKVAVNNNQIQISSPKETMKEVRVYDVLGKLIVERINVDSNELTIPTRAISQQTLLINITLTNGQKVTRKMVF